MARLSIKEAEVHFKNNKAIIRTKTQINIISATCLGLLYIVKIDKIQPTVFIAQLKQKPTSFAIYLAYARIETIGQIISENLVDRLNIYEELLIDGLYEDCIYGKHIVYLYNVSCFHDTSDAW